jgi:integrase
LVFQNKRGLAQDSSSVTDAPKVALDRAGLPQIRAHDLCHTTATVLFEAGAHPKLVQDLLGHRRADAEYLQPYHRRTE